MRLPSLPQGQHKAWPSFWILCFRGPQTNTSLSLEVNTGALGALDLGPWHWQLYICPSLAHVAGRCYCSDGVGGSCRLALVTMRLLGAGAAD